MSELMVCLGWRKSRRITPFISQKTVHISLPAEGSILNFFFDGEFTCSHSMDCRFDPGENFAIFQHCYHYFQWIEAHIQLRTQFPSHNLPIHANELNKTLFILWCDSCTWPFGTWLVFHVAVATVETCHPPPHCANIHRLVSVNI